MKYKCFSNSEFSDMRKFLDDNPNIKIHFFNTTSDSQSDMIVYDIIYTEEKQ